ncbi:MAG: TonB-dependent receptor [Spirochaetes bacterium]|nr:TonB-dependent receptor [Spirochaetota bacterium]
MKRFVIVYLTFLLTISVFAQEQEKEDVVKLQDVIVSDTFLYPGAYQSITADSVKNNPKTDLLSVIKTNVPSFYVPSNRVMGYGVARSGSATLSIRGIGKSGWGPTTGIPILYNGMDTTMSIMGHPVADIMTMKNVERIEVLIGPQPVLFGSSAMGGVINVITKKQKEDGFTTELLGSYGTWNSTQDYLYHMGKMGKLDYSVGYQLQKTDGDWKQTINGKTFTSEFMQQNGTVHVGYALSANWYASVDSYGMKQNIHDPGPDGINALSGGALTNQLNLLEEFDITRGGVVAKLSHEYGKYSGTLQAEGNFGHHESVQSNTGVDKFKSDDSSYALRLKEIMKLWPGNTLTTGAEWRRYGGTAKDQSTGTYYIKNKYLHDTSIYALMDQALFNNIMNINGGARYSYNSKYGDYTSWQTGAAVRPLEKTKIYTNVAKGFKFPDIRQVYLKGMFPAINPNEDLEPETYTSAECGIEQKLLEGIQIHVAGYRIWSDNMFIYTSQWKNADRFTYNGAEASIIITAFKWLSFSAGYSFIDNEQDNEYLPYVPKHKANGSITLTIADFSATLDGEYVNGMYADTAGKKEFDNYFVANAQVSYSFLKKFTAFVSLYNITDKEYSTFAVLVPPLGNKYCEYPMPGFHFLAGMKATF